MINKSAAKWARMVAAVLLAAVLMYLAMRGVALSDAWRIMRGIQWSYLGAALGLTLLSPLVRAWRWKRLYDGGAPGFWLLVRAIAAGQTLNFAVPFRTGDVARVFMVGGRKLDTAGTVALEKLMDAGFIATLCLLLPFVWVVPNWLEGPRLSVIAMAGLFLAVVFLIVTVIPRISRLPRVVRMPPIGKLPVLAGTTLFLGVSGVLVNDFVLHCLGIKAPFMASVVLLVILQAGVAVPSTPGKVGVFQYLAILGLSLFGVGNAPALAFGLVLHLLVFLPTAIMAALFLVFAREKKEALIYTDEYRGRQ